MAIQDPDSERRNLFLTSFAFIAYFYAGGEFNGSAVQLQVVNATFSRPAILAIIAWSLYFWFIYRYWQTHRGLFQSSFSKEISLYKEKFCVTDYLQKSLGEKESENHEGYCATELYFESGSLNAKYLYAASVHRDQSGKPNSYNTIHGKEGYLKFEGFSGWLATLRVVAECAFREESFSSYMVPYLVVFVALLGALASIVF